MKTLINLPGTLTDRIISDFAWKTKELPSLEWDFKYKILAMGTNDCEINVPDVMKEYYRRSSRARLLGIKNFFRRIF